MTMMEGSAIHNDAEEEQQQQQQQQQYARGKVAMMFPVVSCIAAASAAAVECELTATTAVSRGGARRTSLDAASHSNRLSSSSSSSMLVLLTTCLVVVATLMTMPQAVAAESSSAAQKAAEAAARQGVKLLLDSHGKLERLNSNASNPFSMWSLEEIERERDARHERMQQRRERARKLLETKGVPPPSRENLERVPDEHKWLRKLSWFGNYGSSGSGSYSNTYLADSSKYYDKWAQAYRMLGGMIDCDHDKSQNNGGGSHDNNNNNNNGNTKSGACSRWMLWAAYVNPNYQGNAYDEYFGDEPSSALDCHLPDTEWRLIGVYRQEFYQYIEQISKHLWAIDDYEYVVALAGLKYMTKYDCFQVGYTSSGSAIYAGVAPQPYGKFEMALYTDDYCLTPDTSLGMTYDSFGLTSNVYLGSKDATEDDTYSWAEEWWSDTQEYTLTQLNDVYEEFKYCTSCVDYPTYQDGYVIGDNGMDDDDLINQCWKFYSHSSYTCEAECIAMAHAQGSIMPVTYGDTTFGSAPSDFLNGQAYTSSASTSSSASEESPFQRLLANAALTAAFLLFVATFLAFAVARRTRYRESRNMRSRRLLDEDDPAEVKTSASKSRGRSVKSSRTTPRKDGEEADGLYRISRSKSGDRRKKGGSMSRKGGTHSRSSSRKKRTSSSKQYEPPAEGAEGAAVARSSPRASRERTRKPSATPNEEYF